MKSFATFTILLLGYLLVIVPFTNYMKDRPVAVKLGYAPNAEIMKMTAGDYRYFLAEMNVIRVLFYFGTIADEMHDASAEKPEYGRMYNQLVQAAKLDPHNQDVYYFSQAIFTWDVGRAYEVNKLLDHGMKYRVNDWQLPYWAGFNSAYFLKDYDMAARYFQRAAELSGSSLFTTLAARYFHESGQGVLGVLYLDTMIKSANDPKLREIYKLRKGALEASLLLQKAVNSYYRLHQSWPHNLKLLLDEKFLPALPVDPYGGVFFITEKGVVKTTSNFAFSVENKDFESNLNTNDN